MRFHSNNHQSEHTSARAPRQSKARARGPKSKQSRKSFKRLKFGVPRGHRRYSAVRHQLPYMPPEDWYESDGENGIDYDIVVESAGPSFVHVVTPAEIRDRLSALPDEFLEPLAVVKLSGITRKKSRYPLYGMQWGPAIYLYPMDESLAEHFHRPPSPAQRIEAKMYGAKWTHPEPGLWSLSWTEAALRDFYLNNVLIHELGHLLDERNSSVADREAFAEWFAIEHGYKPSRGKGFGRKTARKLKRRHHKT